MLVNKASANNSLDIYTFLTVSHFQLEGIENEKVIQKWIYCYASLRGVHKPRYSPCVCV